jgi:hypothetical protein
MSHETRDVKMTARRGFSIGLAAALTLAVAACSGAAPEGAPSSGEADVDASWVEHTVGPVVLRTPQEWTELAPASEDASGVTSATFGLSDDGSMVRPGITVTVQDEPTRDASVEAESLVLGERAQRGAEDVETTELDRPDAELALGVSLWNEQQSAEGPVEVASRWVVADLAGGEQVVVGVLGPRSEFEELPLDDVLDAVAFESTDETAS